MPVQVKFFASLREQIGKAEDNFEITSGDVTALEIWNKVTKGEPLPANILIAINQEYAKPDQLVKDNDELAFFPPVTGG